MIANYKKLNLEDRFEHLAFKLLCEKAEKVSEELSDYDLKVALVSCDAHRKLIQTVAIRVLSLYLDQVDELYFDNVTKKLQEVEK